MPRKRAERGSIARLDRNRYRIRYWGDKGDGKGYRRLSANFTGTLTEARRERDRLIELHSTNQRTQHTVGTFSTRCTGRHARGGWQRTR